jgi:hypothetical protein
MKKFLGRQIFALLLALCAPFAFAQDSNSLKNPKLREAYIQALRAAVLDDRSLGGTLAKQFPNVNDHKIADGLFIFEEAILDLYRMPSRGRGVEELAEQWGFTRDEAFDIAVYYSSRIFFDVRTNSEDPSVLFGRLKEISLQRFIHENQSRYDYFNRNVAVLGVPQMAKDMNVSERTIYSFLYEFNISIVEKFSRPLREGEFHRLQSMLAEMGYPTIIEEVKESDNALAILRTLVSKKLSVEQINRVAVQVFGFGEQAVDFVLHHMRNRDRGNPWEGRAIFGKKDLTETEILARLMDDGLSFQEIANRLNSIFRREGENIRSERSVILKLQRLGLVEKADRRGSIYLPEYGYLMSGGNFVMPLMLKFLVDHSDKPKIWIAEQLALPPEKIESFIAHHKVNFLEERNEWRLQRAMSRYQKQDFVLTKTLEWMVDPKRGNGRTPSLQEIEKITGVAAGALNSTGHYSPENVKSSPGAFFSASELFLRLREEGSKIGLQIPFFSLRIKAPSEEFQELSRKDAFAFIFDLIQKNGGEIPNLRKIPMNNRRLIATDGNNSFPLFLTARDFWTHYKYYSEARGIPFYVVWADIEDEMTEAERNLAKLEVLELCFQWSLAHGGTIPSKMEMRADLKLKADMVKGLGMYAAGSKSGRRRIFDSLEEFYLALKAYAAERGLTILLLNARYHGDNESLREVLQEEALDLLEAWVKDPAQGNGARLSWTALHDKPIEVHWNRLMAAAYYQAGQHQYANRIFDSVEHAQARLDKRLALPACGEEALLGRPQ